MQIGIGLPNQVREVQAAVIPEWAAQAEEAGFSALGTVGRHAYPGVADTVALAAAAATTSRIELMSAVMLAPTWPGTLLAKELAGIDGVSGGRLTVGIGVAPGALDRMARWGEGYIGGSLPAAMTARSFEAAKAAWAKAGREGSPRLVALVYFALGDSTAGRANVHDYYSISGSEIADTVAGGLCGSPEAVRTAIAEYTDLGVDQIILNPGTDDPDEIKRLAEIVF